MTQLNKGSQLTLTLVSLGFFALWFFRFCSFFFIIFNKTKYASNGWTGRSIVAQHLYNQVLDFVTVLNLCCFRYLRKKSWSVVFSQILFIQKWYFVFIKVFITPYFISLKKFVRSSRRCCIYSRHSVVSVNIRRFPSFLTSQRRFPKTADH